MAKKEEKKLSEELPVSKPATEIAPVASQALAVPAGQQTLAEQLSALGASPGLVKRAVKAASNFALMETPKIPRIKALSDGLLLDEDSEEDPLKEITGTIIFGAKYKAYYEKEFNPDVKGAPPDCFSHNGVVPEPDAAKKQNPVCKTCRWNQFGSAKTGEGKACRDIRRLFLLTSVAPGEEAIMPLQLNVTPSSIKSWDDYMGKLITYGFAFDEVETKVIAKKKNREDKYVTLTFSKIRAFGDSAEDTQILANISALKTLWMPFMERQHVDIEETVEEKEPAPAKQSVPSGEY